MNRSLSLIVLGLGVLTVASAATYHFLYGQAEPANRGQPEPAHPAPDDSRVGAQQPSVPRIRFYGLVVDDVSKPLPGAEVDVSIWKVKPGWSSRNGPPLDDATKRVSLRTDPDGRFEVDAEHGYMLQIRDIRSPGYIWVVDLAWSLPDFIHPDNRFFIYGGGFPIYIPAENRPAVFPLHRKGSATVGMPSRGGFDRSADGTIRPNDPVRPAVPTTGLGAPATGVEATLRLRDLMRSSSTQATTAGAATDD